MQNPDPAVTRVRRHKQIAPGAQARAPPGPSLTPRGERGRRALRAAAAAPFDATAGEGQAARLEALVLAWLEHVAAHRHEHRCRVAWAHLLGPERRSSLAIRHGITLETMMAPLLALVPALAERAEAVARRSALCAGLLNDPGFWPTPPKGAERAARVVAVG